MDTYRLRYFCVIVRTGSLRKAAELLKLSPAALSKALKLLEEEVGAKLTAPSGRGIVITDAGQELAQRAEILLKEIDALPQALQSSASAERPVRIGSFEVFTTHFLPRLLEQLGEQTVELHELIPGHLEQALASRAIDLGITYLPVPHPELDHIEAGQVEMGVFARRGAFARAGFSEMPFVVPVSPVSGSPNRVRGLDGWPDDRLARRIQYRVTLLESALELCRTGRAAAYLPTFLVDLHNGKARPEFQLTPKPMPAGIRSAKQPVFLIKRKADAESSLHRRVAKALRRLAE